jgi:hypothetical protein
MTYYLRTKSGEAKAKIDNDLALKLINDARGHFREAHYAKGKKTVFEFDGDFTYGTQGFKLMLWTGDVLEPVEYS